jgi:hypothetical protein
MKRDRVLYKKQAFNHMTRRKNSYSQAVSFQGLLELVAIIKDPKELSLFEFYTYTIFTYKTLKQEF